MTSELKVAQGLYGNTSTDHSYADRLLPWLFEHLWQLHTNQDRKVCPRTLRTPTHLCVRCDVMSELRYHKAVPGWNLDHVVLLRRGPVSYPTAWALLSQPYDLRPGDKDLGPAPYGHGTRALIYTVDDLLDDA